MILNSRYIPFPDPGTLPTEPPPNQGEYIVIRVDGWPPYKDTKRSIRNPSHPNYQRFVELRTSAIKAMKGRSWYDDAISLALVMSGPEEQMQSAWIDEGVKFVGGIMDTIDGSHGFTFTYLPIVIQDDRQVEWLQYYFRASSTPSYEVHIFFSPEPDLSLIDMSDSK